MTEHTDDFFVVGARVVVDGDLASDEVPAPYPELDDPIEVTGAIVVLVLLLLVPTVGVALVPLVLPEVLPVTVTVFVTVVLEELVVPAQAVWISVIRPVSSFMPSSVQSPSSNTLTAVRTLLQVVEAQSLGKVGREREARVRGAGHDLRVQEQRRELGDVAVCGAVNRDGGGDGDSEEREFHCWDGGGERGC